MNLEESWNITRQHLEAARSLLPSDLEEDAEFGILKRFDEWLYHNELELALDELEGLGELNGCTTAYWKELLAAAENMKLQKQGVRYKAKLKK
jgi:hypothetical protein